MYESFFGMVNTPFARNLPSDVLFENPAMQDVLGRLRYVADKKLFAVVTSDPGCGKSTLLRKFNEQLPRDDYIMLYLSDSKLTPKWFYKGLLEQLGMESGFYRGDAKRQLQKAIEIVQGLHKKRVVCVLDEAHLLDKEMLEEFRFMLNYRFDSESPMALVLVGQTELWDTKLKLQRYAAIRQRIDMYCTIPPLDRADCEGYIRAHLKYAGCTQELFTDTALDRVYQLSSGIPRMINRICEKSLMYAFQHQKRLIDDHMVSYVADHEMLATSE
ncbi:ExeA family protein [[Clostridium] aminophilum]|uniref:ExeA family protein n=1 Tax=[Clostridium] aminophilum TaxID=1526 RepID=UPI003F96B418